jgi:gluconolactonase
VSRTEFDGKRTVLADRYDGRRLELAQRRGGQGATAVSGSPTRATASTSDYEGDASPSEIGANNVYRIDPRNGRVSHRSDRTSCQPNGLAFSPDESLAVHRRHRLTHKADGPHMCAASRCRPTAARYRVARSSPLPGGVFDGFRVDVHGNLWLSAGDGVHCNASDGFAAGQDTDSRNGGQRVLRRPETQSLVHLRHYVPVFGVS